MKAVYKWLTSPLGTIVLSLAFFIPGFVLEKCGIVIPSMIFSLVAVLISGLPVFVDAVRGILRGDFLDEKFLMSIACIGAIILGDYTEAAAVMIFYQIGEYFQSIAVRRSRNSIRSLMDIRPDTATVIRDGKEVRVDADEVDVGETVIVRPGERIPLDGVILSGEGDLDTAALTGESVPRSVGVSDSVESGSLVVTGILRLKTTKTADESCAARILELVENAGDRKSKEEAFITKFARIYTPAVVAAAVLVAVLPGIFGWFSWRDSITHALTFLVISCPCALVISVPLAFFGGIGGAASRGILYKGGNTFSPIAKVHTVAFDKTGTLTTGTFGVTAVLPRSLPKNELLALAASAEYPSNHPIAKCIKAAVPGALPPTASEEISGFGVISTVDGHSVAVGNRKLMDKVGADVAGEEVPVASGVLYVSVDGIFAGFITVSDTVRKEAAGAIAELKDLGASKTVMLSGDRRAIAEKVGGELGLDEVHAELLPNEKYERLDAMITAGDTPLMYVGDGINDAPSIARADIGVAMGAIGQDSAIEAADLVIMSDDLSKLPLAVRIARKTLRISKENIVFALAVKLAVMVFGALGLCGMWMAVFADVGVAVIDILNSMRTLRVKD